MKVFKGQTSIRFNGQLLVLGLGAAKKSPKKRSWTKKSQPKQCTIRREILGKQIWVIHFSIKFDPLPTHELILRLMIHDPPANHNPLKKRLIYLRSCGQVKLSIHRNSTRPSSRWTPAQNTTSFNNWTNQQKIAWEMTIGLSSVKCWLEVSS